MLSVFDEIDAEDLSMTPNEAIELEKRAREAAARLAAPKWHSGLGALREAQGCGEWDDGEPLGRGFSQPYMDETLALAVATGRKTCEVSNCHAISLPHPPHFSRSPCCVA